MPIWSGWECVNVGRSWEKLGGCCGDAPPSSCAGAKVGVNGLMGGPVGEDSEPDGARARVGAFLVVMVSPGILCV